MTEYSIDFIGKEIQRGLDEYFNQWGGPMKYRESISNRLYYAKKLGMSLDQFTRELQNKGYVQIIFDQSGARHVYSGTAKLTPDEMITIIINRKEAAKNAK